MGSQHWAALSMFVAVTACAEHHTLVSGRDRPRICAQDPSAPDCGANGSAATVGRASDSAGRAPTTAGDPGHRVAGAGAGSGLLSGRGAAAAGSGSGAAIAGGSSGGDDICSVARGNAGAGVSNAGGELDQALFFSPVYSAYDGVHSFQVPITVRGYLGIEWETDRPDLVDLEEINDNTAMISTYGAGTARIIARAGPLRGSAILTITRFEPEAWAIGEALYASGVLSAEPTLALPADLSCRNCHSGAPDALSVEYTPQQTGGYSDEDLIAMLTQGAPPPRANWQPSVPLRLYTQLHTWPKASDAEARGLVAYLRSLTPMPACR